MSRQLPLRYDFKISQPCMKQGAIGTVLEEELRRKLGSSFTGVHLDHELKFSKQNFNEDMTDFVTYPNGQKKGATIMYSEGLIRIPAYRRLLAYEKSEFEQAKEPRALIRLSRVIVCEARGLTKEELSIDGFRDHKEMMEKMRAYPGYSDMDMDSIISLYRFSDVTFHITRKDWKEYFKDTRV